MDWPIHSGNGTSKVIDFVKIQKPNKPRYIIYHCSRKTFPPSLSPGSWSRSSTNLLYWPTLLLLFCLCLFLNWTTSDTTKNAA